MMAFTADGQVNRKLVAKRDAGYGVSTKGKCAARAAPSSNPAVDAWQHEPALQLQRAPVVPPK